MTRLDIPEKQLMVLRYIAENGSATEYELAKYANVSSFTAHQAPKALVEKWFLRVVPKGKARTGKTIKLYCLTLEGLVRVLQEEALWDRIDRIAVVNKEIVPEYFKLWATFKRFKIHDVAVKLLRFAVEKLRSGIPTYPDEINGRKPTLRDWLVRASIFPEVGVLTREEHDRWFDAVLADDRIYTIYFGTIKWMYESHKATSETWGKLLKVTQQAKVLFDKATLRVKKPS